MLLVIAMKQESPNATKLGDAIIEAYLSTGEAQSVKQLAPRLGWSEAKVRKTLDECAGCPNRCIVSQGWVESYSKSFPSMGPVGGRKVWLFGPRMETLRDMISTLRHEVKLARHHCEDHIDNQGFCHTCGKVVDAEIAAASLPIRAQS